MSSDAREWVWEHSSSRGTARLVLLSIADRVPDEQCVSWASLSSLAKRTRASVSTVREALARLLETGELKQLVGLTGPQQSTVYRLPLAAQALWEALQDEEGDGAAPLEEVPELDLAALRRYGIRPRKTSTPRAYRNSAGPETGRYRKPAQRCTGNRHKGMPDSGTQNRSEPKVNRRYSSGRASHVTAAEWQVDAETHSWAQQHGHLDRLGEEGLSTADAKWRAHRSAAGPRPAAAWAADWRSWIAREHAPDRSATATSSRPGNGKTKADAHLDALLGALAERDGQEARQ
ncbi:helix-turn-helix domain-containing protein [Streptomyces sp. GZWMJZ-114]|uniref:helix-turn-helix domain-containing protein n=1 Tax=Streptomyces sp. GZWMJZ-114 TaxID=2494734 RepID=UPI0010102DDC|nr:helix-turn-helix domain-containing protein [Streptomyces sp. GZWMJZ-114]